MRRRLVHPLHSRAAWPWRIVRSFGAKTIIGTASAAGRLDFIYSVGAAVAVNLTDEDWPDQVRAVAPDGVDTVLDAVGGSVFDQGLELVAPLGTMVTYGAISGELPTVAATSLFGPKAVTGVGITGWRTVRPDEARADIAEVTRRWQSGDLRPAVHATYPLADATGIHETLEARTYLGRLIAIP